MSPASWVSDGREPWVFSVDRPDELSGRHEALMVRSLPAGERVRHLLYTPLWAGNDAPFGLGAGTPPRESRITPPWSEARASVSRLLEEAVSRLLLEEERPVLVARSAEEWGASSGRRRERRCLREESITLESPAGILLARRGPPMRLGVLAFAVDVTCRRPSADAPAGRPDEAVV
jgi:hypothetical protein